jgi:hypothetical protein
MFARRVLKSSSFLSGSSALRPFTTTTALCRSPALADITPAGVTSFEAKQKEFRERMIEQAKKKDASQSRDALPRPPAPDSFESLNPPTAPNASNARPSSSDLGNNRNVGSQGSSAESSTANEEDTKKKGKLSSLIYGTKEGREMDKEMEHSFSQVLARGKYVHSIVFHEVKPDKVDEYVELVGSWYPRMAGMPDNKVHLVGSWRTEVGDCDTFGMHQFPRPLLCQLQGLMV